VSRLFVVIALLAAAGLASAQPVAVAVADTSAVPDAHPVAAVIGGTIAGVAGFTVGALVGAGFADEEEWEEFSYGLAVGSVVGGLALPLGVHSGNDNQGNLGKVMATSVITGLAGWGLAAATERPEIVMALPLIQLTTCTLVEVGTMDRPDDRVALQAPAADSTAVGEAVTHPGRAMLYGAGAGVGGFMIGAVIGSSTSDNDGELEGAVSGFIGGSILGGLTLPLGVHAGNESQGDLALVVGTSLVTGLAGWAAAAALDDGNVLVVTPLVQLVACAMVETATTPDGSRRRREPEPVRSRAWDVSVSPLVGPRQAGFVVSGTF
jgi:hypothetical protein